MRSTENAQRVGAVATLLAAISMVAASGSSALAAPTAEQKCEAAKNQAAGKYAACRQKAERGQVLTGDAIKYGEAIAKCEASFATSWQKAVDAATSAGATCPDSPLVAGDFKSIIDDHTGNVATALGGDGLPVPDTCGNATIEAGEDCDFGTVGGATCSTATAGAEPFGELACGAGCAFELAGCFPCPGTTFGGSCWRVAAEGDSCTATCASVGMAYSTATRDFAGSGGSVENCQALAAAIFSWWVSPPAPPFTFQGVASSGVGCGTFNGPPQIIRDINPTTGDAVDNQLTRFCACQ